MQGNLTIEPGAKVSGGVAASKVTLAGELDGEFHEVHRAIFVLGHFLASHHHAPDATFDGNLFTAG